MHMEVPQDATGKISGSRMNYHKLVNLLVDDETGGPTRGRLSLARILNELPELSVDFTSAAWLIVCRSIAIASALSSPNCWIQSYPDVPRQGAVSRKWHVLFKDCNTVLEHLDSSLRACREAVVRGVTPLGKDQPLPARRA